MVYRHDFDALNQLNSDCIGWVRIPDTGIDYPVMHTPDEPEKYLNKNYDGYFSYSGVPFLDARCTTYNTNMIIYGHNMRSGDMFGDLDLYRTHDYLMKNPIFKLHSAWEQEERIYVIFSLIAQFS